MQMKRASIKTENDSGCIVSQTIRNSLFPSQKRGGEAIDEMGVFPKFNGVLCHDHGKPYFNYECSHSLYNAHHLRELERAWEQDKQKWAQSIKTLLLKINNTVDQHGGKLPIKVSTSFKDVYRATLEKAEVECPPPDEKDRVKGQRGRLKRSKARNLLERQTKFKIETFRFMDDPLVPFTNNKGENDIRMTKVHQKISGGIRSIDGDLMFCRIRSSLSTCKKNNVQASEALQALFNGERPSFFS